METIQIEITNACGVGCGNCTRFVGHHPKPFFMEMDTFIDAVNSLQGFPNMVGVMGGEPLLHPEFEMMCKYLQTIFPKEQCGLWTCFPKGKEHYREVIAETFGNIFLNDHTREDIIHMPILVASEEINAEEWMKWYWIDKCWVQSHWSASINPHGAFFCEIAASLSMLLSDEADGWPVEHGWWARSPMHFTDQIKKYCKLCGCAMPLKKRKSTDKVDDISPKMLERLKKKGSPKVHAGRYEVHNLQCVNDCFDFSKQPYKSPEYRQAIAARYGMFTITNTHGYETPYLFKEWQKGDEQDGKGEN